MDGNVVNGETSSSFQFLTHLTSYPVVSDSITYFKDNPYGQKSINLAGKGYVHFAKPVLLYFSKPYSYMAPYLGKADSFIDQGLTRFDHTFPIAMEDTETLKNRIFGYTTLPVRVAGDSKKYIFDTYGFECKKCGGVGIFARGTAVVTTGLVVTSESLAWLSSFLGARKERESMNEKTNGALQSPRKKRCPNHHIVRSLSGEAQSMVGISAA